MGSEMCIRDRIWTVWRNYVRAITNKAPEISPAMAIGIEAKRWRMVEICAWRVPVFNQFLHSRPGQIQRTRSSIPRTPASSEQCAQQ